MSGEPPDGLGLTGRERLSLIERRMERYELRQEKLIEMVGDLGNHINAALAWQQDHIRHHDDWAKDHGEHVKDHEARHRVLDLKVYGALAGLGAAVVVAWVQRGGPPL